MTSFTYSVKGAQVPEDVYKFLDDDADMEFGAKKVPGFKINLETVRLPHQKLPNVVNQVKLIQQMRKVTDGRFVYLKYAVPNSSEHYTPYALE